MDYQHHFQGIPIHWEPRIFRVENGEALKTFLAQGGNGSLELAAHMLALYRREMGADMEISRESMAIEILAHVYAEKIAEGMESFSKKLAPHLLKSFQRAMESVQEHSRVIDIGESAVDSNRWVWDALVPFRGLIFALCGKNA